MHPTFRRAGTLAVAVLALMPISSARAHLSASQPVLLRYHFVPGQTFAYRMAMDMRMSMSGTGVPASASNGCSARLRRESTPCAKNPVGRVRRIWLKCWLLVGPATCSSWTA